MRGKTASLQEQLGEAETIARREGEEARQLLSDREAQHAAEIRSASASRAEEQVAHATALQELREASAAAEAQAQAEVTAAAEAATEAADRQWGARVEQLEAEATAARAKIAAAGKPPTLGTDRETFRSGQKPSACWTTELEAEGLRKDLERVDRSAAEAARARKVAELELKMEQDKVEAAASRVGDEGAKLREEVSAAAKDDEGDRDDAL